MPLFASVACIAVVGLGGVCSVGERGEGVPRGDVSGAVGVELDGRGPDAASHGDARAIRHQSILALLKGGFATWEKGAADKKSPRGGRVRYVPLILFAPERAPSEGLPPPDVRPAPAGAFFSTVVHPSSTIDEVADRSIPPLLCVQNSSACQHLSALVTSRYARNCRVRRCAKERVSGHVTRCGGPAIRSRAHSSD